MTESLRVVRVFYYPTTRGLAGAHRWRAQSPDLPGWNAVGNSSRPLCALAEDEIRFALGRADAQIEHHVRSSSEVRGQEQGPGHSGSAA